MFEEERRLSQLESLSIELISALFIILGLSSIGFLLISIVRDPAIQEATGYAAQAAGQEAVQSGNFLLAFLNSFGIVVPLLLIGLGYFFFRLGMRMRNRDISSAQWAQMMLFWLAVLALLLVIQSTLNSLSQEALFVDWFSSVIPFVIGLAIFGYGWWWMGHNMSIFSGKETLTSRNTRLAWNLLIPTVAILIIVAARPLERTFIASLTNETFGGGAEARSSVQFVGLDNYARLLGIRIDAIPCTTTESGECETREITNTNREEREYDIDVAALGVDVNDPDSVRAARAPNSEVRAQIQDTILATLQADDSTVTEVQLANFVNASSVNIRVVRETTTVQTVYPRTTEYIPAENYRDLGYSEVRSYDLFGTHYVLSARDGRFILSIENTLIFSIFSVVLELVLGLGIALVVNSKFPGRGLMRAAMLVPWAIPTVVSARLWEVMLRGNQSGVINHFFTNIVPVFPGNQAWLADPNLQLVSIILVDVWKTTPFMALLLLAGLQIIPGDIYEAADVDGAGRIRQFFNITLPLLRPTIAVALVFRTVDAIRAFDVFEVLLGAQRQSMATYNQFVLVQNQQSGYASAIGVTIFVIILIFTIIYVRALGVATE